MTGILAVDTATEACSVALAVGEDLDERYEVAPRKHNELVFRMLRDLLPDGLHDERGIDAIAYSSGPGSFTGLRIAASAVQGLCFATGLQAVSISTLTCLAQAAMESRRVNTQETLLCLLDARINEIYAAVCHFEDGLAACVEGPRACAPADLDFSCTGPFVAVGDGCRFIDELPTILRERILRTEPEVLPRAGAMVALARRAVAAGDLQTPAQVAPVYVRDEINWKKIPQQGPVS